MQTCVEGRNCCKAVRIIRPKGDPGDMKPTSASSKVRRPLQSRGDLAASLAERIVGQEAAVRAIVPYIQMYQAGLSPEGRPAGVFLLLGPTGTGKTRTVEALAEVLHGSAKHILRIDCGEFQMEHEVAKLVGAPPGYLGHRETQPLLTQHKLNAATSDRSTLAIVLLDEIEKAAPSMARLLLGVLDKATLRLGDNTSVNFERSLIFMTSNLGAREMGREMAPPFGFGAMARERQESRRKLEAIGLAAVRRRYSPEFVNRIDAVLTYDPLGPEAIATILDQHLRELQRHIETRLGGRAFRIEVPEASRRFLLDRGVSLEYGARELRRTIHRCLMEPLAALVASGEVLPGAVVRAEPAEAEQKLALRVAA